MTDIGAEGSLPASVRMVTKLGRVSFNIFSGEVTKEKGLRGRKIMEATYHGIRPCLSPPIGQNQEGGRRSPTEAIRIVWRG